MSNKSKALNVIKCAPEMDNIFLNSKADQNSFTERMKTRVTSEAFPYRIHVQVFKKVQTGVAFEEKGVMLRKWKGFCFWAEKMNLFYPAKQTLAVC